jgi:hypothetical protein
MHYTILMNSPVQRGSDPDVLPQNVAHRLSTHGTMLKLLLDFELFLV